METIIKITNDGDVIIPLDLRSEMVESGSNLPNMIDELRKNGWRTFEHHDNWIKNENYPNPTSDQQFDTGNAFREMKYKK